LRSLGDPANRDEVNGFVRLLWERGTLVERENIAKLNQHFTDLSKATSTRDAKEDRAAKGGERMSLSSRLKLHASKRRKPGFLSGVVLRNPYIAVHNFARLSDAIVVMVNHDNQRCEDRMIRR
jgi:hypothetical protein